MNMYALKGFKVKVTDFSARQGTNADPDLINKYLKIGKAYTVDFTEVHSWSSAVYLQEVPGVAFNTVNFVDLSRQSKKKDAQHPDWAKYH